MYHLLVIYEFHKTPPKCHGGVRNITLKVAFFKDVKLKIFKNDFQLRDVNEKVYLIPHQALFINSKTVHKIQYPSYKLNKLLN